MKDEEIKLLRYEYKDGVNVSIPGGLVYALMQVLEQVKESETHYVFNHFYDKNSKEQKGLDGIVEKVVTTKEKYPSAQAYFSQEPQIATTMLGNAVVDLLMLVKQIHLDEIKKGNALEIGSVIPPQDVKLP